MSKQHYMAAILAVGAAMPAAADPVNTFTLVSQRTTPWGGFTNSLSPGVWSGQTRVWEDPADSDVSNLLAGRGSGFFSSMTSGSHTVGASTPGSSHSSLRLEAPDPTELASQFRAATHATSYAAKAYGGPSGPLTAAAATSAAGVEATHDASFYRFAEVEDTSGRTLARANAVSWHQSASTDTSYSLDTRLAVSTQVDPTLGKTASASARYIDAAIFHLSREVDLDLTFDYAAARQMDFTFAVIDLKTHQTVFRLTHADLFPLGGMGRYERTYAATLAAGSYQVQTYAVTNVAANNQFVTDHGGESEVSIDINWHEMLVDGNEYFAELQAFLPSDLWQWREEDLPVALWGQNPSLAAAAADGRLYSDGQGGWTSSMLEILLEGDLLAYDRSEQSRVNVIEDLMAGLYGSNWQDGIDPDALAQFYATAPEPTTLVLMGLAGAAALRRRRA